MMKTLASLSCALILVSGLFVLSCGKKKPQYEGPHLTFDVNTVDFGIMDQESEESKEVTFQNTGTETVEISDVQSSCGCTAAVPTDRTIDPGEKGILNVTFKSGKSQGDVEKVITVVTNDSISPTYRLPVIAHVKTDITMEPRALDFGEVKLGEPVTMETTLKSETGAPFEIIFVEADTSRFSYEIVPTEVDGMPAYTVKVTLRANTKPQSFYKVINLRTDNTRSPLFRLACVAKILGNLRIEPRTVLLRGVKGGERQSRTVTLETIGDAEVHILNHEVSKGNVDAELVTLEPGKRYEVEVSYQPDEPGRMKDYLVLETDDEFEKEISIPITVFTAKQDVAARLKAAAGGGGE
jgi:hypothetical protein